MTIQIEIFAGVLSFIVGALVGSFANVCVYRLPRELSVVRPRSKCPGCDSFIAWYDNIPMVSWLLLGAKCRKCGQPISWQYPVVEAITGTLFLLVYLRFGLTIASPVYMLLAVSLVIVTFVDLTDWTIPNEITIPGVFIGIACAVAGLVFPESGLQLDDPLQAVLGAVVGGGILYSLDKGTLLLLGKRGMGFGDVKLMAMLGAFFGWQGAVLAIVVASFFGSGVGISVILMKRRPNMPANDEEGVEATGPGGTYLPFGPYLVVGGLVVMFFGPDIIQTYTDYIQTPGAMR